ncbi:hypothetical protein DNTS_034210 [Danionella cerebrum]|uniref:N-alpha-acetyltransferase 30 n=1 Tax=Danionella cerebrum TaxID=2873325 RepID=A0A553MYX1_9TELE|nr:hypothetical protein DNTS_034210 [Danionella translucida]
MAEVPPGPNALPSSPSDITALPVDGCTLLGKKDDGRVLLSPGPGLQLDGENRTTVKSTQNNVHPNAIGAQLNGLQCHHAHIQNHVQQHRSPNADHLHPGGAEDGHTENNNIVRNAKRCCNNSLPSNNGINCTGGMTITESGSSWQENDVRCRTGPVDPVRDSAVGLTDSGPGLQAARVELAAQGEGALEAEMTRLVLEEHDESITYVRYESELQMPDIIRLITKDLSEPYSIYTYRYFIHNWPQLCFLAMVEKDCVGAIVCKLDMHKKMFRRGYIAMLAVDSKFRRKGIGTNLVKKAIYAMVEGDCDEVVLETEITNKSALKLYENLGFVRDKRLFRYYLNGVDALRLKLWLR